MTGSGRGTGGARWLGRAGGGASASERGLASVSAHAPRR